MSTNVDPEEKKLYLKNIIDISDESFCINNKAFAFIGISEWEFKKLIEDGCLYTTKTDNTFYKKNELEICPLIYSSIEHDNSHFFYDYRKGLMAANRAACTRATIFDGLYSIGMDMTEANISKYTYYLRLIRKAQLAKSIISYNKNSEQKIDIDTLAIEDIDLIEKNMEEIPIEPQVFSISLLQNLSALGKEEANKFIDLLKYFNEYGYLKDHANLYNKPTQYYTNSGVILVLKNEVGKKGEIFPKETKSIVYKKAIEPEVPVDAKYTNAIDIDGPFFSFSFKINEKEMIYYNEIIGVIQNNNDIKHILN